jgi:hypothetical protein
MCRSAINRGKGRKFGIGKSNFLRHPGNIVPAKARGLYYSAINAVV